MNGLLVLPLTDAASHSMRQSLCNDTVSVRLVCLSVCLPHLSNAACRCGGFAAVGPAGKRYRSIAAAASVTGELRLQLATRGDSYHCFISTRQTGSIASVSRQTFLDGPFRLTAATDPRHRGCVLTSGPSPRRVANQRVALGGRLGMMDARR